MSSLEGKVALISGAARGIGSEVARRLSTDGATVVIGDVRDEQARAVADGLRDGASVHLDVTSEDDWRAAVAATIERYGQLDILVNNAGVIVPRSIADTTRDEFLHVVTVNQVGTFLGIKTVAPAMAATGGGVIVNTSSQAGLIGMPHMMSYVASKFAIRGMTKVAALELARDGIRVNSIHPGRIDTEMGRDLGMDDESMAAIGASTPLGRIGTPRDVAGLVSFLVSEDSAYCTGAEFVVDGGLLAGDFEEPPIRVDDNVD